MLRLDLWEISQALLDVAAQWPRIDADLLSQGVGRKSPFTPALACNMLSGYEYLNQLLEQNIEPFSDIGMEHMLTLNLRVHYGTDGDLTAQFGSAIDANIDKFNANIEVIADWYWAHRRRGDHPYKLAAETYVSIVGQPQLFLEGNHRTAALIGSWIDMRAGLPPFVLSPENALAYFAPSAEIKQLADRSTWRGRRRLPAYRRSFARFWQTHVNKRFVREVFNCN